MIATEGGVFHDAEADEALFGGLRETVGDVEAHWLELDVNDDAFAVAMADRLHELDPGRRVTRAEALARLRAQVDAGKPIIGAGAGTGLSAKCAEAGGADLIIIYNSGRYRMAGRGSLAGLLPYGDANEIVVDMAREVLPIVRETPVLAGVCGTDPFRLMPVFLDELKRIGFSGVQNFPTVGLFDGTFRQNLEETGMGYGLEVDMIRLARERDLLTAPYVFEEGEAEAMAQAGADVLVPHMGLTTGGSIGADTALTLDDAVERVQALHDAAKRVNPDVLVLCHGGPIAEPEDAAYVLERTEGVVGFFGASSMERLPTETAMTENMRRFKAIPVCGYCNSTQLTSRLKARSDGCYVWAHPVVEMLRQRGLSPTRAPARRCRAGAVRDPLRARALEPAACRRQLRGLADDDVRVGARRPGLVPPDPARRGHVRRAPLHRRERLLADLRPDAGREHGPRVVLPPGRLHRLRGSAEDDGRGRLRDRGRRRLDLGVGAAGARRRRDRRRGRGRRPADVAPLEPGPGSPPGAAHDRGLGDRRRPGDRPLSEVRSRSRSAAARPSA